VYKTRKFLYTTQFQDSLSRDKTVYGCFNIQVVKGTIIVRRKKLFAVHPLCHISWYAGYRSQHWDWLRKVQGFDSQTVLIFIPFCSVETLFRIHWRCERFSPIRKDIGLKPKSHVWCCLEYVKVYLGSHIQHSEHKNVFTSILVFCRAHSNEGLFFRSVYKLASSFLRKHY